MNESELEQFDLLLQRYLDSALDDAGRKHLEHMLNGSSAARREYLRALQMHASLHVLLHGLGKLRLPAPASIADSSSKLVRPSLFKNRVRPWPHRWHWAAAAAILLATGVFVLTGRNATPVEVPVAAETIAELVERTGVLQIEREGKLIDMSEKMELAQGDYIIVPASSSAKVQFKNETTYAHLTGPAKVKVWTEAHAPRLEVEGIAECHVDKQVEGRQFIMTSALARITVLGTVFRVESTSASCEVQVLNGKVKCERLSDGRQIFVNKGHIAVVKAGEEFSPRLLIDPYLVGWWKFDESHGGLAADAIGNNNGTLEGATWSTGTEQGLVFPSHKACVICGKANNLNPNKLTLMARIFVDAQAQNGGDLISKEHQQFTQYALRLRSDRKLSADIGDETLIGKSMVGANEWHHVALSFDGVLMKLYYDGKLDATKSANTFIKNIGEQLRIGGRSAFSGIIKDVRLYEVALSEEEIRKIASDGVGK
jgi:hypothetical protein